VTDQIIERRGRPRNWALAVITPQGKHLYVYLYVNQIYYAFLFSVSACNFFAFAAFSRLPSWPSITMPPNTQPTPTHCIDVKAWPNHTTEMIMVSIFLVTVTVTRKSEPKTERV